MSDPALSMYPAHRIVWKVVSSGRLLPILQPTEENPILSGKLIISVLRARNLFSTVLYGKMDPFVEIRVGNVKKRTSVHKKGDTTPQWDEHLDFLLKGTEDYIKITLKNKKMLMNEIIGVAFIPVDYLLLIHGRKTARASFSATSPAQTQGDNKQAPVYNDPSQAWFDIGREAKQTKLAGTLLLGFHFEPMQISDNMMQQLMNDEDTPLNRTLSDTVYLDGAQSVNSITARLMQEKALRSRSLHEEDLEPGHAHGSPMKNSTMPALSISHINNHGRSPSTIRSLKLFGGPLSNGVNRSKSCVPVVCYVCIQYLLHHGLDVEGIFRVPGSQQRIEEIKDAFEHGESVNICDPHVTAGVLKLYFRKLAEPLIPCLFYKGFVEVEESEKSDAMKYKRLADLVQLLPSDNRTVLSYLLHFLSKVAANSAINKMNVKNLAVVFGPSLLRPTNEEDGMNLPPSPSNAAAANQMIKQMEAANTCVAHLISGYDTLFPMGPPEPFKMDHPHLTRPTIITPRHSTNRLSDPSIQFDPDNRPQS